MFSTVITLYIRNCSAYCLLHIYEKNLTNATEKHTANVLADSIIEVKLRFGVSNSQTPEKNLRKGMSSTGRTNQTAQKKYPLCCNVWTRGYSKPTSFYYCGKYNRLIETFGFDKTHTLLDWCHQNNVCYISQKNLSFQCHKLQPPQHFSW